MLTVRLFASLRERLGSASLDVPWEALATTDAPVTAPDLIAHLVRSRGADWRQLGEPAVVVAVNQQVADAATVLRDGDEVAFLPPVTGG